MSGYPASEVVGRNARFLQGPATDPVTVALLGDAIRTGRPVRAQILNYRADGSTWWNEMHLSPLRDTVGAVTHYLGVQHDVTRAVAHQERAAHAADHDPLTGLANRACFTTQLDREIARSARDRRALAVLFLDVDGFKAVNDTHGHAVGDAVLVQIAARLRGRLRAADLIGRFGGDEFLATVVDLSGDGSTAVAGVVADLLGELETPFSVGGAQHWVGLSVGVALHPRDGRTGAALIAAADAAMYEHTRLDSDRFATTDQIPGQPVAARPRRRRPPGPSAEERRPPASAGGSPPRDRLSGARGVLPGEPADVVQKRAGAVEGVWPGGAGTVSPVPPGHRTARYRRTRWAGTDQAAVGFNVTAPAGGRC